jgi:hypothetical protein
LSDFSRSRPFVQLGAVLVLLAATVTLARPARAAGSTRHETFDSPTWWHDWGMATPPLTTEIASDGGDGSALRVDIARGAHDGTSFLLPTWGADHLRLTYRVWLAPSFDPSVSRNDVKLPGFGRPLFSPSGVCLAACGGAPGDGVLGYSARVDLDERGVPGFYVYDTTVSRWGRRLPWTTGPLATGAWHTVRLEISMNRPRAADGVLVAELDGVRVFEAHDLRFRAASWLHAGGAWFDLYYGGSGVSPTDTHIDIDDVVLELL